MYTKKEIKRFMTDCMVKVGTGEKNAEMLADVLVAADYRGQYSHGLNRLEKYVRDVSLKLCDGQAVPTIEKESAATGLVNGHNGIGPVVGRFSMALAIKKAKEVGVGWVVANNSNHYGIAGIYCVQAMEEKLIGLSCTNTSPFMAPTGCRSAGLGTNPIAVAAGGPGSNAQFVFDIATTASSLGKIEMCKRKGEPIPEGWALDKEGNVTTDAAAALEANCLMPLGGMDCGHKGFGLAFMVEIFSGILSGSLYGPKIKKWSDPTEPANLGHCFIAVDPSVFAPGFEDRLTDLISLIKNLEPVDPSRPIMVSGEPEITNMAKVDADGGIKYHPSQVEAAKKLAEELGVPELIPMEILNNGLIQN